MDHIYKKAGDIFNAHSYWTKQPEEVIEIFIKKFSNPGDVVLDPFCGTGMTGVAAIITNRKFIISDISHIGLHIAKGYCTYYPKKEIEKKLNNLLKELDKYYITKCPHCGKQVPINFIVLKDTLEEKGCLSIDKVVYNCNCCRDKQYKDPDENDYKNLNTDEFKNYFYPTDDFFGQEPRRNYKRGIFKVYQLYSPKNLTVLAILWDRIQRLSNSPIKTLFEFAFTAILFNCSLMSRYSSEYENTKIKMGTYFIPPYIKDNNVIKSFCKKINTILKANEKIFWNDSDLFSLNKKYDGSSNKIQFDDASKLKNVKDNSVDYIYTDPPYSDIISYAELNLVYESWLSKKTDTSLEMIVSRAENKDISDYSTMFSSFLKNAYRVLKDKKFITIIFHNANVAHWKAFQNVLQNSDFIPVPSSQPERLISNSKTASQRQTGKKSQCFLAFNLQKDTVTKKKQLISLSLEDYIKKIEEIKQRAISDGYRNDSDQYDYVINEIIYKYEIREDFEI